MQKKHFLFVVVGLATLSTAWFVVRGNMGYNFLGSMMRPGTYIETDSRMADVEMAANKVSDLAMMQLGAPSAGGTDVATIGMMPPYYYEDDALDVTERAYEKSSYHAVVVDDVTKYIRGLKEYFISIQGVVLNSSVNSGEKYDSASLYVKVPVDKFDEATGRVTEDVEKVVDESLSANDVTGQVVKTQESVQALMDQRSLKEAQLVDAQTELEKKRIQIEIDRLTRQIESAQKAQESVETKTQYSSISVNAASNQKYFNPGVPGDFRYELERAWESLSSFLRILVVFGIWVVVYAVVWAPILWIGSKILRRLRG